MAVGSLLALGGFWGYAWAVSDPATPSLLPSPLPLPLSEPPPLSPSPVPVRVWRWWVHLFILLPYPLVLGLMGGRKADAGGAALSAGWKGLLLVCSLELLVFGVVLGAALLFSKATRDDLRLRFGRPWLTVGLGVAYSMAMRVAIGLVMLLVGMVLILTGVIPMDGVQTFVQKNRPNIEAVVSVQALRDDPLYFWLTLTLVSFVVAGLREELWRAGSLAALRKVGPGAFASRGGEFLAVVLTSLVFGLGHLPQGMAGVGLTTLLGIALGSILVFHRSTWMAVIAHGTFNATSFALIPMAMEAMKALPM